MLTIDLDEFSFELKDGAIKHVGSSTRSATVKLYDIESADVRPFGDKRLKLEFADGSGNAVEVALPPEAARSLVSDVEALRDEGSVFE